MTPYDIALIITLSAIPVLLVFYVLINFRPVKIIGTSMNPTLKDKSIRIAKVYSRHRDSPKIGKIYIYFNPNEEMVIKRLKYYDVKTGDCYFLGDNPMYSIDSRHYGFVNERNIIARLLWY